MAEKIETKLTDKMIQYMVEAFSRSTESVFIKEKRTWKKLIKSKMMQKYYLLRNNPGFLELTPLGKKKAEELRKQINFDIDYDKIFSPPSHFIFHGEDLAATREFPKDPERRKKIAEFTNDFLSGEPDDFLQEIRFRKNDRIQLEKDYQVAILPRMVLDLKKGSFVRFISYSQDIFEREPETLYVAYEIDRFASISFHLPKSYVKTM